MRALNSAFLQIKLLKKNQPNNQCVVFCLVDFRAFSCCLLGLKLWCFSLKLHQSYVLEVRGKSSASKDFNHQFNFYVNLIYSLFHFDLFQKKRLSTKKNLYRYHHHPSVFFLCLQYVKISLLFSLRQWWTLHSVKYNLCIWSLIK